MRLQKLTTGVLGGLAALTAGAMFNPSEASAVALGTPVVQGDHLAVARLRIHTVDAAGVSDTSRCTGSLISPTTILTASHCFWNVRHGGPDGTLQQPAEAVVGTEDTARSDGQHREVVSVKDAYGVDLALAMLNEPVTNIAPLRLNSVEPTVSQSLELVGWGRTDADPTADWDGTKLRSGQSVLYDVDEDTIGFVGSPNRLTSACPGDSGGPLIATGDDGEARILATAARARPCPNTWPSTAVRVDKQVDWIKQSVPDLPAQSGPSPARSQVPPGFDEWLFNTVVI